MIPVTALEGDLGRLERHGRGDASGNYQLVQQYMDVTNYADYMLLEFYVGNTWDWTPISELDGRSKTRSRRRLHIFRLGRRHGSARAGPAGVGQT